MSRVGLKPLNPRLGHDIPYPQRMSPGAAGFDIAAALDTPMTLMPGDRKLVPCGFALAMPPGMEAQLRPRSGLALEHGVTLLNAPATIDADYRGEVRVLMANLGSEPFVITPGARIAQMVFAATVTPSLDVGTEIEATPRGTGGFGSTGH
ncbi:MAG: dUTP diphosphatase [Deltaproteobacteria bacterium]|nr:dUTP diphosphatase [Deltaproteobacteria bacterium]